MPRADGWRGGEQLARERPPRTDPPTGPAARSTPSHSGGLRIWFLPVRSPFVCDPADRDLRHGTPSMITTAMTQEARALRTHTRHAPCAALRGAAPGAAG